MRPEIFFVSIKKPRELALFNSGTYEFLRLSLHSSHSLRGKVYTRIATPCCTFPPTLLDISTDSVQEMVDTGISRRLISSFSRGLSIFKSDHCSSNRSGSSYTPKQRLGVLGRLIAPSPISTPLFAEVSTCVSLPHCDRCPRSAPLH